MEKIHGKIATFLVSLALMLSFTISVAQAESSAFPDIGGGLSDEIEEAVELDLVDGYPDGTYRPQQAVTRAEFAKLVVTTYELVTDEDLPSEEDSSFKDIKETSLKEYILQAAGQGWISGYEDHTFQPNSSVSRQEAAKILAEAAGLEKEKETFEDVHDSAVLAGYVGAVQKAKLMNGHTKESFAPNAEITRGQAAATVLRLYKFIEADLLANFDIEEATISEMQNAMKKGYLTSVELVEFYLDRIEALDENGPKVNSLITINEEAIETAKLLDKERAEGEIRGKLHGIPIVLKDNYDTFDMPTSAGATALASSIPPDDAYQTKELREDGAIILAKANLHEFAFGFQTYSSLGGQTLNPYDLTRYPGGSSGGTAAAVASNFAAAGMGTDTGGSIRIPSTFNNLVGIRPTMGLASRDGIIPLALTQDVGGPLARTVEDAAIMLDAIAGYDSADAITANSYGHIPDSYTDYLDKDGLEGARIGVVRELFGEDEQVVKAMEQAIVDLERLGAEVVDVTIPNLEEILDYPSLSSFEFKFQLNDYLASLGPDAPYKTLSDIIESGKYHPDLKNGLISRNERETLEDEEYNSIIVNRPKITKQSLMEVFNAENLDAMVYPTSTQLPQEIGKGQGAGSNNRLSPFSGYPAMSVPVGFSDGGLPIGMELLGTEFSEPTLIKMAYSYQEGTDHRKAPMLQ
jgi:amidase